MLVMHNAVGRDALYKIWNASDEYMIIYFQSDGGSLVFSDAIYPIEDGSICFISPKNLHYTMPENPAQYVRSKIFIDKKAMDAILSTVSKGSAFFRLFSENNAVYAKIAKGDRDRVCRIFSDAALNLNEGNRTATIIASFFYLMTVISRGVVNHTTTQSGFMEKIIELINRSYFNEISLDELCKAVNMSKSHLCHKFKAVMGITVMEYIFKTRIAAAQALLISGELSVSEISDRCGFSSISYFCQKFKAETGLTANEYKRNAKNNQAV